MRSRSSGTYFEVTSAAGADEVLIVKPITEDRKIRPYRTCRSVLERLRGRHCSGRLRVLGNLFPDGHQLVLIEGFKDFVSRDDYCNSGIYIAIPILILLHCVFTKIRNVKVATHKAK